MLEYHILKVTKTEHRLCAQMNGKYVFKDKNVYPTVGHAKLTCWREHGCIPILLRDGSEKTFDSRNAVHAALERIENRHAPQNVIVAVGSRHYLVRRAKFSAEVPIRYSASKDALIVRARHDEEHIA